MLSTETKKSNAAEWDSFDKAVGLTRKNLIEIALENASNASVVKLLAPEIKMAVMRELFLFKKEEAILENQKEKEENLSQIAELQEIAGVLTEQEEITPILEKIEILVERNKSLDLQREQINLHSTILPKSVCNETFRQLAAEFWQVLETPVFKQMISECSFGLGYARFLSLEELDYIFANENLRNKYVDLYQQYQSTRLKYYQALEQKIHLFCESPVTYTAYVIGHYGEQRPIAFQASFGVNHITSMVDVIGSIQKVKMVIHLKNAGNICYTTQNYGSSEVHLQFNPPNQFTRIDLAAFHLPREIVSNTSRTENTSILAPQFQNQRARMIISSNIQPILLRLEKAVLDKDYEAQYENLEQLGNAYLKLKDYSSAAKLLNGALTFAKRHLIQKFRDLHLEQKLMRQLKELENRFVADCLDISDADFKSEHENTILEYKNMLRTLREYVKKKIQAAGNLDPSEKSVQEVRALLQYITVEINLLLKLMVLDCIKELKQEPPCEYAFVGTGSLARLEMTPYSDLEFFILIADLKHKAYFRNLAQLLELKIINLGETDLKDQSLLPQNMLSPTKKGFSLDVHKNPTNTVHHLIGTPEEMARFQKPEHYIEEEKNHLSGALINTIFITGTSQELLYEYQRAVVVIHRQSDAKIGTVLSEKRALDALQKDVEHFAPDFFMNCDGELLQPKDDLYRLPQTIMDALALHQGLETSSTLERVEELARKTFISEPAKNCLMQTFALALWWRLKTYCHYEAQTETIDVLHRLQIGSNLKNTKTQELQGVSQKDIQDLILVFGTLGALNICAKKFLDSAGKINELSGNFICDIPLVNIGLVAMRLFQYDFAKQCFERFLNLTDNSFTTQIFIIKNPTLVAIIALGSTLRKLGNLKEAAAQYERALDFMTSQGDFPKTTLGNIHINLGLVLWERQERALYPTAYKQYELALQCFQSTDSRTASILCNRGLLQRDMGKLDQAEQDHRRSLEILKQNPTIYARNQLSVAANLNGLGLVCQAKHQSFLMTHFAVQTPMFAMTVSPKVSSGNSPFVDQALQYFTEALEIFLKLYGNENPVIAKLNNSLGSMHLHIDPEKSKNFHEKALLIKTNVYSWQHRDVQLTVSLLNQALTLIVNRYILEQNRSKVYTCYDRYLEINTQAFGKASSNVMMALNQLYTYAFNQGDFQKSRECAQRLLNINRETIGNEDISNVPMLMNIGDSFVAEGNKPRALENYQAAHSLVLASPMGNFHPLAQQLAFKISSVASSTLYFHAGSF